MTIYYTFTPLADPTPHSGEYTYGNDINNSGQVVGTFQISLDYAFLYNGGTYTNIDLSNYINSNALSISNDGHVLAKANPAPTGSTPTSFTTR